MKRKKPSATVEIIKSVYAPEDNIQPEPVKEPEPEPEPSTETTNPVEPVMPTIGNFDVTKTIVTNDSKSSIGSCLRGHVNTTYDYLQSVLGEPLTGSSGDGKVTCQWILKFNCGSIASIYAWKTGKIPTQEFSWSIGGTGIDVVKKVEKFLNIPTIQLKY